MTDKTDATAPKPDILSVLRAFADPNCDYHPAEKYLTEAADEIERLRGRLAKIEHAPDLLAALELAECVYRKNVVAEGEPSSVLDAMQAAIAKARGAQNVG